MNNNAFNTVIFNATPTVSSASGISILSFGSFSLTAGMPIELKFEQTNYVTKKSSNINYNKAQYTNTNYL